MTGAPVGLVLAGGGARGAYEAGVLSVLQPALEAAGARPSVIVGTSVGAINAAHVAAGAHLPVSEAVRRGVEVWSAITKGDVIRPIIARQVPLTLARYAGDLLSIPGVRLPSLLDPGPLHRNLDRWVDWRALHDNVARRRVRSVAVIATGAATGRTVAFVESADRAPAPGGSVAYAPGPLTREHVQASAAIPILFPPVRLEAADGLRGWYVDGGTRLNTPIKPALDLGAERLVIIATDAIGAAPEIDEDGGGPPPDFGDGALHLLEGVLVDPLGADLARLGEINAFLAEGGDAAMRRFRLARGQRPYRRVPHLLVTPERPRALGELARAVFADRYGGMSGLRSPDMRLLDRLIGGDSATHGELLSYLLFDAEYLRALVDLGRADARRVLAGAGGGVPWRDEHLAAPAQSAGP